MALTPRGALRVLALLAAAVAITLVSSVVTGTRMEVQDWDCPPAPASCARPVVVQGFPMPYISDRNGISVWGSAGLVGAALGEDFFHAGAFLANVALYAFVLAIAYGAWRRSVRTLRARGEPRSLR